MKITKREIIISIAIASIMMLIGFFISGKITDYQADKDAEYWKAVQIEDTELFRYGMDTDIGNAFVYGELRAVEPVSFDEIGGEYLRIKKVEEHYNPHTRTVTKTRKNAQGKTETYTETEVYYSWDYYDSWEKHSSRIRFCGQEFDYGKIALPLEEYIDTKKESFLSNVRYKYYGVSKEYTGTIYTRLMDGTISEQSKFFKDCNPEQALERCTSGGETILFWVVWMILIAGFVVGFCYFDNRWLE